MFIFFLPIVDAASFLVEYSHNGRQNISLLLFWSMLLAAANVSLSLFYRDDILLTFVIFPSLWKRMYYTRLDLHPGKL